LEYERFTVKHRREELLLVLWHFILNMALEITMTALLPKYHHDVWSLPQAWKLRREDLMDNMSVK
jgi:hypothetical protein